MILQIIFYWKFSWPISAKNHLLILITVWPLLWRAAESSNLLTSRFYLLLRLPVHSFFSISVKMRKAKRLTKRIQKAFVLESSVSPVPPPRKSLSSTELALSALSSSQKSESSHSNHRRSSSNEDVSIESDDSDRDSGLFLKTKSSVVMSRLHVDNFLIASCDQASLLLVNVIIIIVISPIEQIVKQARRRIAAGKRESSRATFIYAYQNSRKRQHNSWTRFKEQKSRRSAARRRIYHAIGEFHQLTRIYPFVKIVDQPAEKRDSLAQRR